MAVFGKKINDTGTDADFVLAGGGGGAAVSEATEDAPGIVELATVEEAMTGEDAVRAVTPEGLAAAISDKAPLASPMFTGTPTAASGTDTTQIATTAFVKAVMSGLGGMRSKSVSLPSYTTVYNSTGSLEFWFVNGTGEMSFYQGTKAALLFNNSYGDGIPYLPLLLAMMPGGSVKVSYSGSASTTVYY